MIGDLLEKQLVCIDLNKEEDMRKILRVVGQGHLEALKEYDKLMLAWGFWDTAVYAELLTWGTSEAAKEWSKLKRFESFLGTMLVGYGITLGQVLEQ